MSHSPFEFFLNQLNVFSTGATTSDNKDLMKRKAATIQSNVSKWAKSSVAPVMMAQTASSSKILLQRTSSFDSLNICEHCVHDHMRICCMYVYDDFSDIKNYSAFKKEVETPYWIKTENDAFDRTVGGSTPKEFPLFSENTLENIDKKMKYQPKLSIEHSQSVVFVRQYFWPLFLPDLYNPFSNILNCDARYPGYSVYPQTHTTPCVMRQVAIPIDISASMAMNKSVSPYQHQPQVIETHSWVPWWMLK